MSRKWLEKWYSIMLPLFPLLILYGFSAIPFLSFSDYLLLLFIFVEIISSKFKIVFEKSFVPLVFYLLFQPMLLLLVPPKNFDFVDSAGTAWKLALYIFGISLLQKNLQKDILLKSTRFVGTASTIYGFFQFFLGTYLHISLSPYFPLLPILRTGLKEQQDGWISYGWTVRPRAWFSEPSTFAIFLLWTLVIELFVVEKEGRNKNLCFIYVFGIVISRSSTGIIGLIILLVAWTLLCPEEFLYKIPKKVLEGGICLLPVCLIFLCKGGYIDSFISHTFVNGQGLSAQSHFTDIGSAFRNNTGFWNIVIGNGMQDVEAGYLPGWFRTYYCLGIVGVLLYISAFFKTFKHASRKLRILVVVFIGLNFGTEIMLGVFILLFMSIITLFQKGSEETHGMRTT